MVKYFIVPGIALISSLTLLTPSIAESPVKSGPEIISLKMGANNLTFKHRVHQKNLNNECWNCHKTENGKIDNWSKDTAHTLCIPCHDLEGKGPVECKQCHGEKMK